MSCQVSIILINYRQAKMTLDCIRTIREQVHSVGYEIVVVDNASGDGSLDLLSLEKGIVLLPMPENVGFGTANNRAAEQARGEYLFLLNNDTLLENDPFPSLMRKLDEDGVGAVGGYLRNAKGTYTLSGGSLYSAAKYLGAVFSDIFHPADPVLLHPEREQEVGYVIGADLFIRRSLFEEIGGFDERIFLYFEDVELCQRLHDRGYRMVLIPEPRIIHLDGGTSGGRIRKVYNKASLVYCLSKKYPAWRFRLFQWTYFLLKLPMLPLRWSEREYIFAILNYQRYLRK